MNALSDLVWSDCTDQGQNKVRHAQRESDKATARLQGMKLRTEIDPPRAAAGSFPYQHRTCAQWIHNEQRGRCPLKRRGRRAG